MRKELKQSDYQESIYPVELKSLTDKTIVISSTIEKHKVEDLRKEHIVNGNDNKRLRAVQINR